MTCCVAAICDDGKTIISAADRMVGVGYIQSELDISKMLELHKGWRVLISGDDITPVFDMLDYARAFLRGIHVAETDAIPLHTAMAAIKAGYEKKRLEEAEALYLTPTGWDVETFKDAADKLPDYGEIRSKMGEYSLPVELMVAGFSEGLGYIFSLNGTGAQKGLIQRHDIPGFYAIGSGSYGALYMMYYREMSFREKARATAYYVMEAKLFGEQAGGVGEGTDMYCETADGKFICFDEEGTIEKKFIRVWSKLRPKWFGKESVELLNSIPELDGFELIEAEAKPGSSKKTTPRDTNTGDSK